MLRTRMGSEAKIEAVAYGESVSLPGGPRLAPPGGAHPRLGAGPDRARGRVCVVSGDYKVEPDATCAPFEPVRCHVFITESTFGLPIYRWPAQAAVFDEVNAWWRANQAAGKASLLFAYALGKSQRLLAGLDPGIGPIYTHGAVEKLNRAYRETGVALPETTYAGAQPKGVDWSRAMILAPPSAHGTPWARKFGPLVERVRVGLDADPRGQAPSLRRSRLRPLRPRRLAGPARGRSTRPGPSASG